MIDLYLAPTANGLRASVALEEAGLAYRAHKVDLAKGEQRAPEFLKLNPAGAIPVIVDSDGPGGKPLTLSQSGAIILYVADKCGKFLPKDAARRAIALQWFDGGQRRRRHQRRDLPARSRLAREKPAQHRAFQEAAAEIL
jgi:GST-like protein